MTQEDLSRFGRNYKETGNYLERIFPFLGVRFIAINDAFDTLTAERTQEGYIVPLKNLINEVYSKDISRKIDAALHTKQCNGEFIGAWAPYGYDKDPANKNHLIVNEKTAPVVRRIFRWRAEGVSLVQIGRRLNEAGVPSPSAYLYETGAVKTEKYKNAPWYMATVKSILSRPAYLGHMVQGRKRQSFYEGKPQFHTPQSEWKIVEHTHEAIIDQELFDAVQSLNRTQKEAYHARLGKFDDMAHSENILKELVYCRHCGRPLVRYKNVSHGKKLSWHGRLREAGTGHGGLVHSVKKTRADWITVEAAHEGIIEPELFQAAQAELKAFSEKDSPAPNANPLRRKVVCGCCGYAMQLVKAKAPYYRCCSAELGLPYGCKTEPVSQTDIQDAVLALIRAYAQCAVDLDRLQAEQRQRIRQAQKQAEKALTALQNRRQQLVLLLQNLYSS